jgi:hemerythrin-like metal-binding protein
MSHFPKTDHALIDAEHVTLLDWVQRAVQRLRIAYPTAEALYELDVVRHLARSHFEHERHEMREAGYPFLGDHERDHARLIGELTQLRAEVSGAADESATDEAYGAIRRRLNGWLFSHVGEHDARYVRWLKESGAISHSIQ